MIIRILFTTLDYELKLPLLMIFMEEFCVLILMCLVDIKKILTEHILWSVELLFLFSTLKDYLLS